MAIVMTGEKHRRHITYRKGIGLYYECKWERNRALQVSETGSGGAITSRFRGTKTQHLSVHPSLSSYDLRHPLQYEATYKAIVLVQESDLHIQENTSRRVRPSHIGLRAQEIAIR
jgi:hypothetical protein